MAKPAAARLEDLYPEPVPAERAERYWADLIERFQLAGEVTGVIERDYAVAGVPLRVRFAGEAMERVVAPAFKHLERTSGPAPERTVLVWDTDSTGVEPPPPIWRFEEIGPIEEVLTLGGELPVRAVSDRNHSGLMAYDAASSTLAAHYLDSGPGAYPWYERAAPFRAGLHWLVAGPDRHLIHAAAVGSGGRGALIAGPGGSGKSTLAVACHDAGLEYAGDDYVVATTEGGLRAHSLYATAKVDAGGLNRLGPRSGAAGNLDFGGDEKAVLDLDSPGMVTQLEVTATVAPVLTGERASRLERIRGGAALRALGPSSIVQLPRPRGEAFATAARLAREVPAWRLHLGTDLPQAVECVRQVVSGEAGA